MSKRCRLLRLRLCLDHRPGRYGIERMVTSIVSVDSIRILPDLAHGTKIVCQTFIPGLCFRYFALFGDRMKGKKATHQTANSVNSSSPQPLSDESMLIVR